LILRRLGDRLGQNVGGLRQLRLGLWTVIFRHDQDFSASKFPVVELDDFVFAFSFGDRLNRSPALNELEQYHHNGHDQQDVNQPAHRGRRHHSQRPQNQQNYTDGP